MATVYLAHDERHNRNVALKVLKAELAAVGGAERFLAEIETTAKLTHPHILPLHDSGEADGFLFFVTPYIEGDTLRDKIDREKQLSVEEALKITSDIAEALDHAHRHGVVHRDIKPANVLLTDGRPLIADFGIALAVAQAGGGRVTETGLSVGTPHYMSPEQATGDRDVDPRTDLYALGCVLYEMLLGEPPYSGTTAQAVLAKILTDPAPAPTKVRLSIPPNVDAAIRKALEKLPADRFASAQDFATALGGLLWRRPLDQLSWSPIPGVGSAANPEFSPDGESVAFITRNSLNTISLDGGPPLTVVSDSVLSNGLAWGPDGMIYFSKLGFGIWRVAASGGEEEEVIELATGENSQLWPDVLPNGKGILFTRDLGASTDDEIAVRSVDTGEVRALFQGAMARYAHSGHIVYTSGEGTLLAAPFDPDRLEVTGPSRALVEGVLVGTSSASQFALSDTGALVYRLGERGGGLIPVWVDRDGSEEVLDPELIGYFESPAISPNGRRVAFQHVTVGGTENIWIYDLDQETFSRLTFEGRNIHPFWSPDGNEVGFSSDREGSLALYTQPADFSGEARLLVAEENRNLYDAVWTPDRRWLVYRRRSPNAGEPGDVLYAAPHPDSTGTALLDTPFAEHTPSLSPDGRWLAYVSAESGQPQVYVRPFPGPGGRSQVSAEGGNQPGWAHNGREIFYLASDGSLTVAAVRTDPDFAVESRERLTSWAPYFRTGNRRQYDPSPGDQRLLAIRAGEFEIPPYVLVQNFFEELRQVVTD